MPLRSFIGSATDNEMLDNIIGQIEYIADRVGADHVGLSSDSYVKGYPHDAPVKIKWANGNVDETSDMHTFIFTLGVDLNQPDRWKKVIRRLSNIRVRSRNRSAYQYSIRDLKKIAGGNFIRVLRTVLPGYTKPQIGLVKSRFIDGSTEYYFDWPAIQIKQTPNDQFASPLYQLFIYAKNENEYARVFTSSRPPFTI